MYSVGYEISRSRSVVAKIAWFYTGYFTFVFLGGIPEEKVKKTNF